MYEFLVYVWVLYFCEAVEVEPVVFVNDSDDDLFGSVIVDPVDWQFVVPRLNFLWSSAFVIVVQDVELLCVICAQRD